VALGLIALRLAAIGWLVRRELWRSRADVVAEAAMSLPPGALYYAVSLAGSQVGYASTTVDTLGDTLRVSEVVVLEVPVPGDVHRTESRTDIALSRALRLRGFAATVRGDEARFTATGEVEGDSVLVLRLAGMGAPSIRRLRLSRPLTLPQLLPFNVALSGEMAPGHAAEARLLDPVLLTLRDAAFTVAAESTLIVSDSAVFDSAAGRFVSIAYDTLQAWPLRLDTPGAQRLWVDDDGLTVLATWAGGLRVERAAFEVAYENFRRLGARAMDSAAFDPRLVRRTAIAAGAAPPDTAGLPSRLTFRLGGQAFDALALDGGRQRLAGDTLTVSREGPELESGYRLPAGRRELASFVRAEPLIESDDPRLQAQARQIIGRARRAEDAAARLVAWVHQNIRNETTASVPSALDVLELLRGDCSEHTMLFVALARAVGLPARNVTGLMYLDGRFYYHAWPEVYLDGWVAVDPTFGQFPADAGHLRLAIGGLARQLDLVRLVGGLTIEVLAADPGG
jgi:transglutaminase-like putative cysteine protease